MGLRARLRGEGGGVAGQALVRRYEREFALVWGSFGWLAAGVGALFLVAAPLYVGGYFLYVASIVGIQVIAAVGLNVLVGFTGQISLGQAGFVAIGAYTAGLLLTKGGAPVWVALLGGGTLAGGFGWALGYPALRLKGPYLAIATLGFGVAVHQVLTNWEAVSGGRTGLTVAAPRLGPWVLASDAARYELVLAVAAGLVLAAYNIRRSYVGRAFMAVRDSDLAAQTVGIRLSRYKMLAFAVSAFYAGVAGALTAVVMGYLEPNMFTFLESVYYLGMVVVGGLGSVSGSVLGAVLMASLPYLASRTREFLPVVYGAVIVLVMAFEPLGIYGRWLRVKRYFKSWPL